MTSPSRRWIPCDKMNRPMIKWGNGCMEKSDAAALRGQVYLGENLKGCDFIVIDCDGDHGTTLNYETIEFLWQFADKTHCLMKPKLCKEYECWDNSHPELADVPASFHLTFQTERKIRTQHFHDTHIDVVGNAENSLRYWKNKVYNGIPMQELTQEVWDKIIDFAKGSEDGN